MAIETFADATPDSNIAADDTNLSNDQSQLVSDAEQEQATPNSNALFVEDQHLRDQETVSIDDLVIQERQKQIDLVTGTYGVANSSDLASAQAALTAAEQKKANDEKLP